MKKTTNRGFTLVELLAVIVILAIVLIIAVPGVLSIIDNSRKDALISTSKTIKDAARLYVTTTAGLEIPTAATAWIPLDCLEADISENGYNATIDQKKSYVAVTRQSNGRYLYYAFLNSGANEQTLATDVEIGKLARKDVKALASETVIDFDKQTTPAAPAGVTPVYCDAHQKPATT